MKYGRSDFVVVRVLYPKARNKVIFSVIITSLFFTHQNKQHIKNKEKVRVSSHSICRYFSLF